MQQNDVEIFKKGLYASLKIQGLIIVVGVVAMLAAWTLAAKAMLLDPTYASRCAIIGCVPILLLGIFYPLIVGCEDKRRIYVVGWFVVATFFNVWWEMPQVIFIDIFHEANQSISLEKLQYFIPWWGYTTSDLDYYNTTRYFILAEVSFWVINLLSFIGVYHMFKGSELRAMLWFLICGVLQIYNVICIFIPHGYIVEQGQNIATDSILAPIVFWAMNLMWVLASAFVTVFSFKRVMELQRVQA